MPIRKSASVTFRRDVLHQALGKVGRMVPTKDVIPILGHIRIALGPNGAVELTATDLDITATATIEAQHASPGAAICVLADTLGKLVAGFSAGAEIVLSWEDERAVQLKHGRSRFKINALPVADWPEFTRPDDTLRLEFPAPTLVKALASIAPMMLDDTTRFYLRGVSLLLRDGQFELAATTGVQLGRVTLANASDVSEIPPIIIPDKTVNEVIRLGAKVEGDIALLISSRLIGVELPGLVLYSKLIDASYPDYQRIIPKNERVVTVDSSALAAAVDRVRVVAEKRGSQSHALRFVISPDGMTISGQNADAGEGEEQVAVEFADEAFNFEIGFNGGYFAELVRLVDADMVRISLGDSGTPMLAEGVNRPNALFLLMPMRV